MGMLLRLTRWEDDAVRALFVSFLEETTKVLYRDNAS